MRIPKFKPLRIVSGKSVFWRIVVPAYLSPTGKRKACYYTTKAEALVAAADYLAATRERSDVRILSKSQQGDALRALELLAEQGLTASLVEAVEAAIPTIKASGQNLTVASLFAEFEGVKAASWSAKSMKNFRDASKLFLPEFGSRMLASVTARDLTAWLASRFASDGYRANIVRTLRPAFSYGSRGAICA